MDIDKNIVLVSVACLFQSNKSKGTLKWFIIKPSKDADWELPKVIVRKAESSVRAIIRTMGEKGSMTVKVLEEVGRAGGVATANGKTLPQRYLYYLIRLRTESGEAIGFSESAWLEYAQAVRKLSSKRERTMLKEAKKMFKNWKKEREKKKEK